MADFMVGVCRSHLPEFGDDDATPPDVVDYDIRVRLLLRGPSLRWPKGISSIVARDSESHVNFHAEGGGITSGRARCKIRRE